MKIRALEVLPRRFRLDAPVLTARGTWTEREGFRLRLTLDDGRVAWGEATPLPLFGTELLEDAWRLLSAAKAHVDGRSLPRTLEALDAWVSRLIPSQAPASRYAVELALLDALAQLRGEPLAKLLAPESVASIPVNALLSAEAPEALAEEAGRAVGEGFQTLKVKLLGLEPAAQAARLEAVRRRVGTSIKLRVDANGMWAVEEARHQLTALLPAGLELCEQPVAAGDWAGWRLLHEERLCPLAADESMRDEHLGSELGSVDILVLKPTVLGGLLPCLRQAKRGEPRPCLVTHALEGAVARAGAVQLAAVLARPGGFAFGVSLSRAADEDVETAGFAVHRGIITLPTVPGLGFVGAA